MRNLRIIFSITVVVVLALLAVAVVTAYPPQGQRAFDLVVLLGSAFALGWRARTRNRLELVWCKKWAFSFKRYPKPAAAGVPSDWTRVYRWILRVGPLELRRRDS